MRYPSCIPIALAVCLWLGALPGAVAEDAIDAAAGVLRLSLDGEPMSLNSLRTTDQYSAFVLYHSNEGLLQYAEHNRLAPAIATDWQLDTQRAVFRLRHDARWENGAPVTAQDFVFAWRQLVDPHTAAQYATLLNAVRNAREIVAGSQPPETLGVSAPDAHTLVVDFAEPCAWFPELTVHMSLLPINEAFYRKQGERYAADAGRLLANGPFRLAEWVHGARLVLERNPLYWNAAATRLQRIEMAYFSNDPMTQMNLFRDGRVAIANIPVDSLSNILAERRTLRPASDGYVRYLRFNFRPGHPSGEPGLRKAIQAAIDPGEIVNRVLHRPGLRATDTFFSSVVQGIRRAFIREYPLQPPPRGDELARQTLAGAPKLSRPLHLLTLDAPDDVKVGEYIQARLRQVLGIEVRIDRQTQKQFLRKNIDGDFDVSLSNWGPDYNDPMTYGDLLASWNPNNRGHYASAGYDALVAAAQASTEPSTRMQAFDRMQQQIRDEVPVLPLYENALLYVQHPRLHGVVRNAFGADPILRNAWLER